MSKISNPDGDDLYILVEIADIVADKGTVVGGTFFITAKANITDSDASAALKAQKTMTDNNDFTFHFSSTQTAPLDPDINYICDIRFVAADGSVETWPKFNLKDVATVTQRTT